MDVDTSSWNEVGSSSAWEDAEARRVYVEETEGALTHAGVRIGGTFWGRAVGETFLRVRKPRIPFRMFASLDEAMPWIEEMNRIATRPVQRNTLRSHG